MSTETLPKPEVEFTDYELDQINTELERMDPLEIIAWSREMFGDGLIGVTSGGATAPIMLKFISEVDRGTQLVNVRLGHESEKTKTLIKWYEGVFGLKNLAIHGDNIPVAHGTQAVSDRKVELFQREVVDRYRPRAILMGGTRDGETEGREDTPIIRRQGSFFAIRPVLNVTRGEVNDFFALSGYPRNIDYNDQAKGPEQKKECGIHLADFNPSTFGPSQPSPE